MHHNDMVKWLIVCVPVLRHHCRKYSMPEDPVSRKRSGAFLPEDYRKMSIKPEEASVLQELDQDDLTSE